MIFLSLVVVLVLVQLWGSGAPLQRDGWFYQWLDRLASVSVIGTTPVLHLVVALAVPALVLIVVTWLVCTLLSANWLFFVYVPVLLYSLGRGDFSADIKAYLLARRREDSVAAAKLIDDLRGNAGHAADESPSENWEQLNAEALRVISYRGFERMFAVLFWFFILGPVGALLYRLSVLYRERLVGTRAASCWLWLIEWPAVRMMGLTWALVGNFDTCFRRLQRSLTDTKNSSMTVLSGYLTGALGVAVPEDKVVVDEVGINDLEVEITEPAPAPAWDLVKSSQPLFSRGLLLWVCALALVTLLI